MKYLMICIATLAAVACGSDNSSPNSDDDDKEDIIEESGFIDSFDGDGDLEDYVTNNAEALPDVSKVDGRYRAELLENGNNQTLHFNEDQGRLDAKRVTFPFEFLARNIGIGTINDSQVPPAHNNDPYNFAGVQVHVLDLNEPSSSHVVIGHRGPTGFTIEGKNTVNGSSSVNDAGANIVPDGRADIRVVGNTDRTIRVYWQLPNLSGDENTDDWILYNDTGLLPGDAPTFESEVYVGLITYAYFTTGVPFVGTCDQIEIY